MAVLGQGQAKEERAEPPAVAAINDRMSKYIAAKEVAGAVTLVATPDRVLHLGATGSAAIDSGEAMRPDAIFWIASMSKPILATLMLMLQDEGLLSVDDPVEKYLPEFKGLKTADGKPAPVTIRHLLTHTSGMGEITADQARASRTLASVIPLYVAKPVALHRDRNGSTANQESAATARTDCRGGHQREPLEKLLKRRLFDPLGMRRHHVLSHGQTPLPRLSRVITGCTEKGELEAANIGFLNGKLPTSTDRFPAPNGGLFSTASDYGALCQMVLRAASWTARRRYLKPETVKFAVTTVQTADLKTGFTPGNGWGLKVVRRARPQGITAMLSPGTFGHGSGYGTEAWIDPETKRDLRSHGPAGELRDIPMRRR